MDRAAEIAELSGMNPNPSQTTPADTLVIGGGIVGLSCGLHLRQRGLSVTLADPGEARRRTSYGNAGVISRGSIFPVAGQNIWKKAGAYALNRDPGLRIDHRNLWRILPWLRAFLRASNTASTRKAAAALDPFVAASYDAHLELAALTGAGALIQRRGWLKLYRSEAAFAASAVEREMFAQYKIATEIFDAPQLRELEPALQPRFARALLFTQAGSVSDPGALVEAYGRTFASLGGEVLTTKVGRLSREGDFWCADFDGGFRHARKIVLAAGAWAPQLTGALGYKFPLAVERGYHQHFALTQGPALTRPIHDVAGAYIAAPMRQGVRILSGIELAPRDAPADVRQFQRVLADARGTLALGAPVENEPWLGARPSTPDGLPVIGEAPRHPGLFFAFGHGHIGLSTGPVTGRIIADLVMGRVPDVPVAAFAAQRFAGF